MAKASKAPKFSFVKEIEDQHREAIAKHLAINLDIPLEEVLKKRKKDIDANLERVLNILKGFYYFDGKLLGEKFNESEELSARNWSYVLSLAPVWHSFGDTIGYRDGIWEFNNGEDPRPEIVLKLIYQYFDLGGIYEMNIQGWRASDDTILYLDTLETLLDTEDQDIDVFGEKLRERYLQSMPLLEGRHPGTTTIESLESQKSLKWDALPYNARHRGNGAVMRAGCIGLMYPNVADTNLFDKAIICSIITHNSTVSVLACITVAFFTSFAASKLPLNEWIPTLLEELDEPYIKAFYMSKTNVTSDQYDQGYILYKGIWEAYQKRFFTGNTFLDKEWMEDMVLRYKYLSENFSKGCDFPGGCADDCLIYVYDSLLRCNGSLEKLTVLSILHPGDSDTVGAIAFQLYWLYYGNSMSMRRLSFTLSKLEFKDRLKRIQLKLIEQGPGIYYTHLLQQVIRNTI